ncbi:MAG TPA: hypothetical protein VM364_04015 [Vicinamibacterales bacterium]|nr:hypothetical protein [Vicinamibacterales bacterium]
MATDIPPAAAPARPRPWLLVLLVLAIAFTGWVMFSGGSAPTSVTSTPPQRPDAKDAGGPIDPAELDVKIEALKQEPEAAGDPSRNPFRFQPKAPQAAAPVRPPTPEESGPPPPPPGPPPIGNTIKFIGIVDTGQAKVGAFSDCKATFAGREGEVIEGRYRVVRIGVESAVVEYVDGKGRTTLPLNGQACVGK